MPRRDRHVEKMRKSIEIGLTNRLKARGLEDSTDVVAVQAVCDLFAVEINAEMKKIKFKKPLRQWKLTVKNDTIWIGFEGDEIE